MFFSKEFLTYTASSGGSNLEKIITVDPRDPQRDIGNTSISVTLSAAVTGDLLLVFDRLSFGGQIQVSRSGQPTVSGTPVVDPYLSRNRLLLKWTVNNMSSFTATITASTPYDIGTLQILKRADGLATSGDLFVTYPFERLLQPRTVTQRRVDGSTVERVIGREQRLTMRANLIPVGDFTDQSDDLEQFSQIALAEQFFFDSEHNDWDFWLLKTSTRSRFRHVSSGYNNQRVAVQMEAL